MSTETTPLPQSKLQTREQAILRSYWRSNLRLMSVLLAIWAFVGLGCGVLFADVLNQYTLPGTGYPLGFWFAQQGSIVTFVVLILVYALAMNRLDRIHHEERAELGPVKPEEESFTGEGI
ncbi:DUF4212 domain-containing protein [Puniceicoccales bacterium CK1056]|uniref:DUF4212 domain-containing protein n=1 Tax=Oceanipulchritudo coccoides TaxID=2706888 RepID=A0A6B2M1K3_9BACT|nr:DUF4212 domain-containing protein [Oceanipulchritudo coccoides]NDV62808.1 DUF4212 domain-containing protein [Oceanipulchritudo coccoides]